MPVDKTEQKDLGAMARNGSISSSGISTLTNNSNSSDYSVYHIYKSENETNADDKEEEGEDSVIDQNPNRIDRFRHANVATQSLSLKDKLKLARIYYLRKINIFRLIFIACCVPLFFITASKVWYQYYHHKTVVNVEFIAPKISEIPSITICVHIGSDFDEDDADKCVVNNLNKTLQLKDVVEKCKLSTNSLVPDESDVYNCDDIVPVIVSHQYGYKCFTYFSDFHGTWTRLPEEDKQKYRLNFDTYPMIEMFIVAKFLTHLDLDESDVGSILKNLNDNSTKSYFMLHSPSLLPFMQDTGQHFLLPHNRLVLRFKKKIEHLLPPPFHTNCFESYVSESPIEPPIEAMHDPLGLDHQNDLYRSQGECWEYCLWRELNQDCVNFYSMFTQRLVEKEIEYKNHSKCLKYCPVNDQSHTEYWKTMERCLDQCRPPCYQTTFSISKSESLSSRTTSIRILWANEPIMKYEHYGIISTTSFLGNIGGHLHVWLGISVVEIFNYFVHLIQSRQFSSVFCCMYNWIRN